jgi:O-antigen ligase
LEFLSEHGLFGFSILIVFLLTFFCKRILYLLKNKNEIFYLALLMNTLLIFIPFLPSGSFFSSFNASIFWLNISILLAFEKKRKLFHDEKNV